MINTKEKINKLTQYKNELGKIIKNIDSLYLVEQWNQWSEEDSGWDLNIFDQECHDALGGTHRKLLEAYWEIAQYINKLRKEEENEVK